MIAAFNCCWLGVGLWMLASQKRGARSARQHARPRLAWLMRVVGTLAFVAALRVLAPSVGVALGVVALLLATMTVSALAALTAPLWPRCYTVTVPLSAALAAAMWTIN